MLVSAHSATAGRSRRNRSRRLPHASFAIAAVICASCSSEPPTTGRSDTALRGGVADLVTPSVELGTLPGTSGVSREGAATYHVPIDVPPGRLGMQPSLAVAYSSSGANGPLGVGFSLQGLSEISRCPLDSMHPEVVRDDAVDLCFGGRLILVTGEHMVPGAVYRVPGQPQLRVGIDEVEEPNSDGAPGTTSLYFRVSYPDGRVGSFGSTSNARGEGRWMIARLEDRDGNYIRYEYTKSADGLEHLPQRIVYTISSVTGPGYPSSDPGSREVAFEYEDRPVEDRYTVYRAMGQGGAGVYRRLKTIITRANGAVVHRYRFSYTNHSITGRSQLRRLKKCDALDACLPETDFTWTIGSPAPGYQVHELPPQAAGTAPDFKDIATSTALDVDHDGKIEMLFAYDSLADHPAARWQVWDPETGIDELPIPARFVEGSGSLTPAAADFNGDGVTDLIAPFCNDGECLDNAVANIEYGFADRVQVILGRPEDPDGLATPTNSVVLSTGMRILIAAVAEIDGDGFPDMFVCARDVSGAPEHAYWRLAMNRPDPGTGTGRRLDLHHTQRRCLASELYQVMDADGDRRDELWVPEGNYARLHPGTYATANGGAGNPQTWAMMSYAGLELPYRGEDGAILSIDAALAQVSGAAVEPTMWPAAGVVSHSLELDFSARILRGCWKPEEGGAMPPALHQQVFQSLGGSAADDLAALYHAPSNPSEGAPIAPWLFGGPFENLMVPDGPTNVPANVPFVQTGPGPDMHVDLNGDGLVDIARVVVLEGGEEVQVYDQQSGDAPPYCRADETFDYGLGLWINTGAGFQKAGVMKLLTGHQPWRAAQLLSRISPLDFNSDGRADFLTPNYSLFEDDGAIDRWHILLAELADDPAEPLEYLPITLSVTQPWYDGSFEWSQMAAQHLSAIARRLGYAFPSDLVTDEFPDLVSRATTAIHLTDARQHDIIFFPGSDAAAAPVALERSGTRPDYLTHLSDGLGAVTEWDYAGAHEHELYELGTSTETAAPISPHVLVRERREDLGLEEDGFMRHRYRYRHALADRRGLGSLGITWHEVERLTEGESEPHEVTRVVEGDAAVYDHVRKVYPFRGRPTRSVNETRFHRGDDELRRVHEVITSWREVASPSSNFVTIAERRTTRTFEIFDSYCSAFPCAASGLDGAVPLDVHEYEATDIDELGNVERSVEETGDHDRTTTVREYENLATTTSEPYFAGVITREQTTSESPLGHAARETTYDYNWTTGRLRIVTREPNDTTGQLRRETELIRDVRGNIMRTYVTASGQTRMSGSGWDGQGYFEVTTTNAAGQPTVRAHHAGLGLALRTVDPNGVASETCVDGFGRRTCSRVRSSVGGPTTGEEMTYVLEPASDVIGGAAYRISTRRNGLEIEGHAHDRRGRQRQRVWHVINGSDEEGDAYQQITLHDTRFQIAKRSIPLPLDWPSADFPGTSFVYDETGRLVSETDAAAAEQTYYYDGKLTVFEDADGREIRSRRDQQGRQIWRREGEMVTCFDHGAFGVLAQVRRNCEGTGGLPVRTSIMHHDAWNRLTYVADPDLGNRLHALDGFDQVDFTIDGNGDMIDFRYDSLGRLIERTTDDGLATWEYDQHAEGIGKPSRSVDETGKIERLYYYDAFGRSSANVTAIGSASYSVGFGYTGGRLTEIDYPGLPFVYGSIPYRIRYEHDDYGHVRAVYDDVSGSKLWEAKKMDGWGHLTEEEASGNDVVTQRFFEPQTGRPAHLLVMDENGDAALSRGYGWTPGGNLDVRTDPMTGLSQSYGYDDAGQLTKVVNLFLVAQEMKYDRFGNITLKSGIGEYSYHPTTGRLATAGDQSFDYDGNGNLLVRKTSKSKIEHSWTAIGKLAGVAGYGTSAHFQYDADGVEVVKHVGTKQQVVTIDGLYRRVDPGVGPIQHRYSIPVGGRVVAEVTRAVSSGLQSDLRYVHADYRGSTLATSDATGTVTASDYDAWGVETLPGGGGLPFDAFTEDPVSPGFSGHDAELVAGMIDMGARYYDPRLGRFHSADPIVPDPARARDWNRYAYVRNNPLRYTDPTGHAPADKGSGGDEPKDTASGEGSGDDGESDDVCFTMDGTIYCPDGGDWADAGAPAAPAAPPSSSGSGVGGETRTDPASPSVDEESDRALAAAHAMMDKQIYELKLMLKDAKLAGKDAEIAELKEQLAAIEKEKSSLGKNFGIDLATGGEIPLVAAPGGAVSVVVSSGVNKAGTTSAKAGLQLKVIGFKVTAWGKVDILSRGVEAYCSYTADCSATYTAVTSLVGLGKLSLKAHSWTGGHARRLGGEAWQAARDWWAE